MIYFSWLWQIFKESESFVSIFSPVGLNWRINQLHLYRAVRLPHYPMSFLDKTLYNLMWAFSNAGALRNVEYPFIAISHGSTQAWSRSTWKDKLNFVCDFSDCCLHHFCCFDCCILWPFSGVPCLSGYGNHSVWEIICKVWLLIKRGV